jgi:hypothetical protein
MRKIISILLVICILISGLIIGQLLISSATKTRATSKLPDLAISQQNITILSSSPIAGEAVTLNATVSNIGTADASNVEVNFYEESTLISSKIVDVPVLGFWDSQTIDSEGSVGYYSSIATDNAKGIHIAYLDETNFDLKYAYKPSGGNWMTYIVDSPGNTGKFPSLAIDSSNGIHICYQKEFDWDLKYAYKPSGGNWTTYVVDSPGQVGGWNSIAIDNKDGVHISYLDETNYDLKYAYKPSGGIWSNYSVDIIGDVGTRTSIDVDSTIGVHISYHNTSDDTLKYANKPNKGNWSFCKIDKIGDSDADSSIIVDSKNGIHISYHNDLENSLKYAYKPNGGGWTNYTVDFSGNVGHWNSIAKDNVDGVHVSYRDWTNRDLKYAYKPYGGNWTIHFVDSPGDVGMETSITIDKSNNVHISYLDWGERNLKYANRIIPTGNIQTSISWTPTITGLRNITVKLDENNLIQELNETNNEVTICVNVKPGPLESIKILPSPITLELNETQQFNATGYDAYGNKISITPTWDINGGGTLNQSGLFSAKYPGKWIIYANHSNISGKAYVNVLVNNTADTDSDGILDWWEIEYNLDPFDPSDANFDSDSDSLTNLQEFLNGTDPHNSDTDGDSLGDGFELTFSKTNPTNWDTNGNGVGDGLEFLQSQGYLGWMQSLPNDWIGMTITWDNYTIFIKTNSSVLEGEFEKTDKKLTIKVSGAKGTKGVTEIDVPKSLCKPENISVKFDGNLINYNLTQNATYYHIHIEYHHSVHDLLADFNYEIIKPNEPVTNEPVNGSDEDDGSFYFYIITLIIIVIIIIILIVVIRTRNNRVTNDIPELPPEQLSKMLEEKHAKGQMTDETYNDIRSKLKKYQDQ